MPIANVQLCPFSYEEGNLYFTSDFTISLELEEYPMNVRLPADVNELESQLRSLVDNPEDVNDVVAQIPAAASVDNRQIDYLIITSNELYDSFIPLIEWKRKVWV